MDIPYRQPLEVSNDRNGDLDALGLLETLQGLKAALRGHVQHGAVCQRES